MATPSRGFEVIFTQKFGEQDKQIEVNQFFTNEKDFYENREESYIEIKENLGLTITFRSQTADAQFFMDGLETLPERRLAVDPEEGEVYLSPSEEPVTLFDHTQEYYPLIPGLYRIVVVYQAQQYYGWIKVLPKQLEEAQWEIMKQEVEKELTGLARDFMLRKTGLNTRIEGISQELLEQFFVINNRFSSVMAALSDLYRMINYRINKEYQLVPKEKSRFIDERTVRYAAIHPENEHSFKAPVSAVTYDLPENRFAKKIIDFIFKTLTGFIDGVELTAKNMKNPSGALEELEKLCVVAGKMRGAIQWIKTAPWYESVGVYQASGIPYVMNSDPRYRALYQLYRELNHEHLQLQIHKWYSYQWKRTDQLYEIWGFIQVIKSLAGDELAFVPESGWVYSQDFDGNGLLVPALPSNTEVVFRKGDLRIHLVYEGLLPTESKLTTEKNPLYTKGTHTCPDGRLDVYENDLFIGSIIFDFKYRPRKTIWDENLIYSRQLNDVMKQLVSYGDHIHSYYLFGAGESPLMSRISPVQEVWAIYPNRYGSSRNHLYPDHKVRLIELTPGQGHAHLTEKIKEGISCLRKISQSMTDLSRSAMSYSESGLF